MRAATAESVVVRRTLSAPPERVFRAFTDPDTLLGWFGPEGAAAVSAEIDLRVGGRYRVGLERDGERYHVAGSYVEVQPPRRLVFTWKWEDPAVDMGDESRVTVEMHERADTTELVVTHEHLATEPLRAFHTWGWHSTLAQLAELMSSRS